jgi:hypothetical protein
VKPEQMSSALEAATNNSSTDFIVANEKRKDDRVAAILASFNKSTQNQ